MGNQMANTALSNTGIKMFRNTINQMKSGEEYEVFHITDKRAFSMGKANNEVFYTNSLITTTVFLREKVAIMCTRDANTSIQVLGNAAIVLDGLGE